MRDADGVARVFVRRTDPFFGTNTGGVGLYPAFTAGSHDGARESQGPSPVSMSSTAM